MRDEEATAGVVRVPRLLSADRGMWVSVAAAVVGALALAVWAVLTRPLLDAAFGTGCLVLVVLVVGGLALRRHELDTRHGAVVRVWGPGRRPVAWREAEARLVPNRGGPLLLAVRRPGGRATHLPLLAADLGGARSQSPVFLRLLADEVERGGHGTVAGRLRAQAEHLDGGGDVLGSPLHRLMATSR